MKKSRVASISKIQAFILTFIFIIGKNLKCTLIFFIF